MPFSYMGGMLDDYDSYDDDDCLDDVDADEFPPTIVYRGGRGRGHSYGRGQWAKRGSGRKGKAPQTQASISTNQAMADHWDELLVRALSTITSFLPAPYSDEAQAYDMLPHGTIPSLILMSKLPELLGTLLRNDSITDWTARSNVYSAMLGLLRRFSDCELTMEVRAFLCFTFASF